MGEVTKFPDWRRPPMLPPLGDPWETGARAADERYALAVLERMLPTDAQRNVAGRDLVLIVSAMLREVDTARHERRLDPAYDERRAGGELGALERLFGGPPPRQPGPGSLDAAPDGPDCA